jgi:hypothetical protein
MRDNSRLTRESIAGKSGMQISYKYPHSNELKLNPKKVQTKKKINSADLEISLPEPDDASSLCDSNHPLCKQYMQCCPDADDCNKVVDYASDQRRLMLCQNKPSRYHSDNTTPVQCWNDAVVAAISCRQHNSSAIQKHANELKLNLKKVQTKKSSIPQI